jgi:two-component system, NarL family, nitrate/nitrite response regulator NarL
MSDGIRTWLSREGEVWLVTAFSSADALLAAAPRTGIVLLDVCDRTDGGCPAPVWDIHRLTARHYQVLALGSRPDPSAAANAYLAGAVGYVSRQQTLAELSRVIHEVAAGHLHPSPPLGSEPPARGPKLSVRERAMLIAYVSGMTLEAAARYVGIRPTTAKTYLRRVKAKYQAAGRPAHTKVELARRLWEEELSPERTT